MVASTSPKASTVIQSARLRPRVDGRKTTSRITAKNASRSVTMPTGPTTGKKVTATAAPDLLADQTEHDDCAGAEGGAGFGRRHNNTVTNDAPYRRAGSATRPGFTTVLLTPQDERRPAVFISAMGIAHRTPAGFVGVLTA